MILRDPPTSSNTAHDPWFNNNGRHKIVLRHPGYLEPHNILLALHAPDAAVGGGIHYGTAFVACAIIACNRWNGYLTRERNGPKLEMAVDDVLQSGSYYFHIPDAERPYPIYPSFRDWEFPHNNLPPHWKAPYNNSPYDDSDFMGPAGSSNLTATVLRRDKACIVSRHGDCVESAHLCPRAEIDWYNNNSMSLYNINCTLPSEVTVDDVSNAFTLRCDIHRAFDASFFVIVPKLNEWVAHFLTPTQDLGQLYHNVALMLPSNVSSEALISRFAWSIFPLLAFTRTGTGRRKLRIRATEHGTSVYKDEDIELTDYRTTLLERGRSRSPKKRYQNVDPPLDSTTSNMGKVETGMSTSNRGGFSSTKRKRNASESGVVAKRLHLKNPLRRDPLQPTGTLLSPSSNSLTPEMFDSSNHEPDSEGHSSGTRVASDSLKVVPDADGTHSDTDLAFLRRKWLRAQRPKNPALYCCNYVEIDADIRAGRAGRAELDGGYYCPECLGFEYIEDRERALDADLTQDCGEPD